MENKGKNPGYRMTREQHTRLRKLAVDRDSSVQALIDEAVQRLWFAGEVPPPRPATPFGEITKEEERILSALLRYWREAPEEDILRQVIPVIAKAWGPRRT